jgi:hypothetical protein
LRAHLPFTDGTGFVTCGDHDTCGRRFSWPTWVDHIADLVEGLVSKTVAECLGCGERIALIGKPEDPYEKRWLHYGWQHEYDHLPEPKGGE